MRNKTFRAIGATVVLLSIGVAAMLQTGNGDSSAVEVTATVTTVGTLDTTEPSEGTSADPEPFGYRVGLLAGVSTTNFWQYIGDRPTVWNAYVLGPTKPALYGIDPGTNALVPDAAAGEPADPTWDKDGWRVHVPIDDDLAWSNGELVTAADLAFTFETVRRLGLTGGWLESYPAEIEAMVVESPQMLRIEFTRRPSLKLWPYGVGLAPIMPARVWKPLTEGIATSDELYELDGSSDVAGGPLQVITIGETRIESVANPGYPGTAPGTVTYIVYPDETAAVAALQEGQIDTVISPNGLSAEGAASLEATPGVTIEKSPANSVRYLGFNLSREPMSDPRFRQAVALLLDREAAIQSLVPDASAAYTMLSGANKTWYDVEQASAVAEMYAGDLPDRLSRAVTALQEAGYVWTTPPSVNDGALVAGSGLTIDGRLPAPLTILTPGDEYDPARSDYTRRIEATLEILGFDARPVITDFDTVIDHAFTVDESGVRQYDMYVLGWTLGNPALPDYYGWLFASDGSANSTGYSSAEFDSDLSRYEQATNAGMARSALWNLERSLATDLPYLVLYHPEIIEAYRSDRVEFGSHSVLGGIQGRLGGIEDLTPAP